jgi:hypothetical protein
MQTISSNVVLDKISCIFVCAYVNGSVTEKLDRSGEKYLATNQLNGEIVALLQQGNG